MAVRCSTVGSNPVNAIWFRGNFDPNAAYPATAHEAVMQINIIQPTGPTGAPAPLPAGVIARRPCYLADLSSQTIAAGNSYEFEFALNGSPVFGRVNGDPWHNPDMYVHNVTLGTVQEIGEFIDSYSFPL